MHFRDTPAGYAAERRLRKDLQAAQRTIAILRSQLEELDIEPIDAAPAWTDQLSIQEATFVHVLLRVHPHALDKVQIYNRLPHQDHVKEGDLKLCDVLACKIRKKLGKEVIETIWGRGYRISTAFWQLAKDQAA